MSKADNKEKNQEKFYKKLLKRDKDFLFRLLKFFTENSKVRKKNNTKKELSKILVSDYLQEVKKFYSQYRKLRDENINLKYAKEYLNNNYELKRQELNFSGHHKLLLLIYELGLQKDTDKIIKRTKINSSKSLYSYILNDLLEFERLKDNIRHFHKDWNVQNANLYPLRVKFKQSEETRVSISILREYGKKSYRSFKFREKKNGKVPIEPEVEYSNYFPLKKIDFDLKVNLEDKKTLIIFTSNYNGWKRVLNKFFNEVFGITNFIENIIEKSSNNLKEIEEEIINAFKEDEENPLEFAQEKINNKIPIAIQKIGNLKINKEKKKILKKR